MLADLITDLTRKVEYKYSIDGIEKIKVFEVKGLSIRSLANIFNHKLHGAVLLKMIEGIDINNENTEEFKNAAVSIIDTKYATLVYHIIACCVFTRDENNNLISCENDYMLFNEIPFDLTLKLLTNALELTLPNKETEVKKEIKKLLTLLATKS